MSAYRIYKITSSPYWRVDFGKINGQRIRQSTGAEDKKQAEVFAKHRQAELWRTEKLGEQPSITWDHAVVEWVNENEKKISLEDDKQRLRELTKTFRGQNIAHISGAELRECAKNIPNLAPATRNRYMAAGRAILNYAHAMAWRPDAVSVKQFREPLHRVRYLTPEEAGRLLNELPGYLRAMAAFSLATGLRESNVRLLDWANVDMARSIAWIHADQAKGGKSLAVPLNASAMAVLTAQQQTPGHWKWVFPLNGRPCFQCNTTAWSSALKRAGIEQFRWHDLRHTWASWHVQNGTSLYDLKTLGGWASMAMVERYAHMTHERVAAASGNIDGLIPTESGTKAAHSADEITTQNTQLIDSIGRSWQARTADQRIKRAVDTRPGNHVFPRNIIDLETKNLGRKIPKQEKNSENVPRDGKNPAQKRHRK